MGMIPCLDLVLHTITYQFLLTSKQLQSKSKFQQLN